MKIDINWSDTIVAVSQNFSVQQLLAVAVIVLAVAVLVLAWKGRK